MCEADGGARQDCNTYLEALFARCADANQIFDPSASACVPITTFKRGLMACSAPACASANPYAGYAPFSHEKPTDIFRIEGNLGSNTIIVFAQGGPAPQANLGYLEFLEGEFLVAYVAQTSMLKPTLRTSFDVSVDAAEREIAENVELIRETVLAVREAFPGKRIVLAGFSMGTFLSQAYLAKYGNDFDQVVLMAARLDAPLDFIRHWSIGQNVVFHDTGKTRAAYMRRQEMTTLAPLGAYQVRDYQPNAVTVILAAAGAPRYTTLLKDTDLGNTLYLYSSRDEQLGGLSPAEVSFLQGRGATILDTGWDDERFGHRRMLLHPDFTKVIAAFAASGSRPPPK